MVNFTNSMDMPLVMVTTGAFPLDGRGYFTNLADAEAEAAKAATAGTEGATYYFGQLITVVAENSAKLYIIQPDRTLKEVGFGGGNSLVWNDFAQNGTTTTPDSGVEWLEY